MAKHTARSGGKKQAESEKKPLKALPTCQKCQSYKVSWDSVLPHSCLFFSFKSHQLPAVEVYNSTGLACPQFRLSPAHEKRAAEEQRRFRDRADQASSELAGNRVQPGYSTRYSVNGELLYDEVELPEQGSPENEKQEQTVQPEQDLAAKQQNIGLGRILGEKGILL